MGDVMSSAKRSRLMSRIRDKNTVPELNLRHAVWSIGLRYRLHLKIGSIKTDLVFTKAKVAIFVDGCFWHQCPIHGVMPKGNYAFWQPKLERNMKRDIEVTQKLILEGWEVLRFWEHEIDESAEKCAQRVAQLVASRMYELEKK